MMVELYGLINDIMNAIVKCGDSWLAILTSLTGFVNRLTAIIITVDRRRGIRKGDAFLGFHIVRLDA